MNILFSECDYHLNIRFDTKTVTIYWCDDISQVINLPLDIYLLPEEEILSLVKTALIFQ
jgi:hypothetical protein